MIIMWKRKGWEELDEVERQQFQIWGGSGDVSRPCGLSLLAFLHESNLEHISLPEKYIKVSTT